MKFNLTFKIWIMIIFLILALLAIFSFPPTFLEKGVIVKSIDQNSSAFKEGLTQGETIIAINENQINDFQDYSNTITNLFQDTTEQIKIKIQTKENLYVFFTDKVPEIVVEDIPKTKIKTGLDLQGGARALIKPEIELTSSQMDDLIAVSNERFNVYGLTDVSIRQVSDLSGNKFMLVEIAGATPKDLESLIAEQGKFEAKIGNETVFVGGNNDVTYVCRNDAQCARIERCDTTEQGEYCSYSFTIHLSEQAAKKHAKITEPLGINETNPGYLDKTMDFYVDEKLVTSLLISEGLRGRETTQIQISGSGSGSDRKFAIEDAQDSMNKMQTILITGSLPYKLEIVKLDTISPLIGQKFNYMILITALAALAVVAVIVLLRYKDLKATSALLFTSFSEIVILLGVASLIKWNLDLPSIVGILIIIGTGVDQQIVILDESKSKRQESMKQKLKSALFIVIAAYFTTLVSLLPLAWAGAGLLKGFAITTLIGLTIGVLITRPAFSDMVRLISEKNAS